MKKKNVIIIVIAILLAALCGFLLFGNKSDDKPDEQGGLQLGLTEEEKEDSKEKDSETKEESKTESSSQVDTDGTSTDPEAQNSDIPEGGQAVDNGDGSVTIIINDDEDTFGF